MLPTEDAIWVGEELTRRFGLPRWMFTLTATDANRAAAPPGPRRSPAAAVLVFSYCYHGSVDEASPWPTGTAARARGRATSGPPVDPRATTIARRVQRPRRRSRRPCARGDVACVLAEPAMTNMGIVLPDAGYLDGAAHPDARARARC